MSALASVLKVEVSEAPREILYKSMSTAKWSHGQDFGIICRAVPARWAFMLKFTNHHILLLMVKNEKLLVQSTPKEHGRSSNLSFEELS